MPRLRCIVCGKSNNRTKLIPVQSYVQVVNLQSNDRVHDGDCIKQIRNLVSTPVLLIDFQWKKYNQKAKKIVVERKTKNSIFQIVSVITKDNTSQSCECSMQVSTFTKVNSLVIRGSYIQLQRYYNLSINNSQNILCLVDWKPSVETLNSLTLENVKDFNIQIQSHTRKNQNCITKHKQGIRSLKLLKLHFRTAIIRTGFWKNTKRQKSYLFQMIFALFASIMWIIVLKASSTVNTFFIMIAL